MPRMSIINAQGSTANPLGAGIREAGLLIGDSRRRKRKQKLDREKEERQRTEAKGLEERTATRRSTAADKRFSRDQELLATRQDFQTKRFNVQDAIQKESEELQATRHAAEVGFGQRAKIIDRSNLGLAESTQAHRANARILRSMGKLDMGIDEINNTFLPKAIGKGSVGIGPGNSVVNNNKKAEKNIQNQMLNKESGKRKTTSELRNEFWNILGQATPEQESGKELSKFDAIGYRSALSNESNYDEQLGKYGTREGQELGDPGHDRLKLGKFRAQKRRKDYESEYSNDPSFRGSGATGEWEPGAGSNFNVLGNAGAGGGGGGKFSDEVALTNRLNETEGGPTPGLGESVFDKKFDNNNQLKKEILKLSDKTERQDALRVLKEGNPDMIAKLKERLSGGN